MKKQGDLYLKIVSIVLAGIVVAYLVLSVLSAAAGAATPSRLPCAAKPATGRPFPAL